MAASNSSRARIATLRSAPLIALTALAYFSTNNLYNPTLLANPFVTAWELQNTPFSPWAIIPYLSFFPFLTWAFVHPTHQHSRALHQYLYIQLLANLLYCLNPLPVLFSRTNPTAPFTPLFEILHRVDQPLNSCPSLHVALTAWALSILAHTASKPLKIALFSWATAIIASTLLTHQHHLIDVLGGILLFSFVAYSYPRSPPRPLASNPPATTHRLITSAQLAGLALLGLAVFFWTQNSPLYFFFLWFALAPATVSLAYRLSSPRLMHKRPNGTLPLSTKIIHAPLKLIWALSRIFCSHTAFAHPVFLTPQTGLRPLPLVASEPSLDLTAEYSLQVQTPYYQAVPLLDMLPPSPTDIGKAILALEHLQRLKPPSSPIWINCAWGRGRSVAIAIAWLVHSKQVPSLEHAIALVHEKRPGAVISPPVLHSLNLWLHLNNTHPHLYSSSSAKTPDPPCTTPTPPSSKKSFNSPSSPPTPPSPLSSTSKK